MAATNNRERTTFALLKELNATQAKLAKKSVVTDSLLLALEEKLHEIKVNVKPYTSKTKKPVQRYVNILLSDLHFGADLDPREVPTKYGQVEERRRLAAIAREVIEYKTQYRDHTGLIIHLAGDLIQGRLHDAAAAAPVAEQMTRAIYLLSYFVGLCAAHFPTVEVYCTPGNHGRNKSRHDQRAVDQKWDSYETVIHEAVRVSLRNVKNVRFHIPKTPFYEYELFGMKGFVTHGDTVINPGFPGRAINVSKLEQQVLKLISARGDYKLVAVGHVHVPSVVSLPSGVLMTNGCLIPPDPYALSIGLHANVCVQQLWETVPGYMVGDHRMLHVDKVDNDASLDKVIPPDDAQ